MVCCKRRLSFVLFCQCCITFFFGFELLQLLWLSGHHSAVQVNSISYTKELTSLQVTLFNVIIKKHKGYGSGKNVSVKDLPPNVALWWTGVSSWTFKCIRQCCRRWMWPMTNMSCYCHWCIRVSPYLSDFCTQSITFTTRTDRLPFSNETLRTSSLQSVDVPPHPTPPTHPRWHASTWLRHEYLYGHRLILRVVRDREIMHVYMFVYIVMISTCRSACVEVTLAPPLVSRYIVKQRA